MAQVQLHRLAVLAFSYSPRELILAAKGKLVQRDTGRSLRSGGSTVAERRGGRESRASFEAPTTIMVPGGSSVDTLNSGFAPRRTRAPIRLTRLPRNSG